jgi:hypothetical protein
MTEETLTPYTSTAETWRAEAKAPPMVEPLTDRKAAAAMVATVAAAFLAQLLFVRQIPGINFPVWIAVVLGAVLVLRRRDARIDLYDLWLPPAALGFATFIAIRDDASLLLFNVLACSALTLAAAVAMGGQPITRTAWRRILHVGGAAVAVAWFGIAPISRGLRPMAAAFPARSNGPGAALVRGLLIALPIVIGFVLIFAAADAVFSSFIARALTLRVEGAELVARLVFAALAGWLFAGTMAAAWLSVERYPASEGMQQVGADASTRVRPRLGTTETLVVLVSLDVLFAVFVLIQAAYLFPGADPIALTGLTYAEYARRGFFELVFAVMLAGALILTLDYLVAGRTTAYRLATAVLVLLIGAVLVSAAVRLSLYQQAYGWTELRFYVLTCIGWLALGLVATLVALAVNRVSTLPKFMLGSALVIALACNFLGPQAFVTAQNLQRIVEPALVPADGYKQLDVEYIGYLGADSILVALDYLPLMPPEQAAALRPILEEQASEMRRTSLTTGWPSWNFARQRALEELTANGF